MTPAAALLLPVFEEEMDALRRVLERLPDDRLDVRPHPRSMSAGELGLHLARIPGWVPGIFATNGYDLENAQKQPPDGPLTLESILEVFEANRERARAALAAASDEALAEPWSLRRGGAVVRTMTRAIAVRRFLLDHLIHHRGQLTVHLRILDVPVPGLYGQSADEP